MTEGNLPNAAGAPVVGTLVGAAKALIFSSRPIPQPASYHNFADKRVFFGVPNFMDVISNLPLLFVGVWGLLVVADRSSNDLLLSGPERWPTPCFSSVWR